MGKKVSIIIPVYNTQKYIQNCLESLCNQKYQNIEIVVVIDGATDASAEICDEIAERDSRIRVIKQENKGLSAARNTGLSVASGEYLMFVDSDDYVTEEYVSSMVTTMENNPEADMAICRFYNAYEHQDGTMNINPCVTQVDRKIMSGEEILLQRFGPKKPYYVVVWNKIYKRLLWDTLLFPVGRTCEDAWVSLDIYSKCKKVVCIDEMLYFYRVHEKSISHTKSFSWIADQMAWLQREIDNFLLKEQEENIKLPAREYVSLAYKNRGKINKDPQYRKYWDCCMSHLLQDRQIRLIDKMKYLFYKYTFIIS